MGKNNIVEKALRQLNAANESSRKNDIEERLDYYYDDFHSRIDTELESLFQENNYENIKLMIDDSINLVEYVVNEIAVLYSKEVQRILDKDSKRWDDLQVGLNLDLTMDKTNKLTRACNECGIVIVPRNNTVELDILTPNMISIIQEEENPTDIHGFIYEINLTNTVDSSAIKVATSDKKTWERDAYRREFIYYDKAGNHFKFDNNYKIIPNEENPDNENPYKDKKGKYILPLVLCHRRYNENSIWDETTGHKLYSGTKQIAVISSLFNYYLKVSSFKQPVITGNADVTIPDKQILDPLKVLKVLGENAGIDLLDFQGDLEQFKKQILHKIEILLNQEGLALDDFMKTGSPESGYKLQLKKEPQKRKIDEQKPFFRIYENELFEKVRIVNNTFYPDKKIDENLTFKIDFPEFDVSPDPEEKMKQTTWEIHNNLTNPLNVIMENNPDVKTEEEAQKVYDNNKAINERLNVNLDRVNNNLDKKIDQITGGNDAV